LNEWSLITCYWYLYYHWQSEGRDTSPVQKFSFFFEKEYFDINWLPINGRYYLKSGWVTPALIF
jgi:hypothetical protein